jgi:anaerobic dimethyl sulfoxide reductase subunit C (anchor subunit)
MEKANSVPAQVFLVLFPAAVGCLLGSLVIDPGFATGAFVISALTVAAAFALAGAFAPVFGIKKPPRSYRFLRGLGRSPLSRQALLVGLFTVLLVIHWALVLAAAGSFALGVVTVVVGAAAVLAIGLTYWLPSQPGWRHWSTHASLFGGVLSVGVAAALVVALAWPDSLAAGSAGIRAARVLVIVGAAALALATIGRSMYLSRGGPQTKEIWALIQDWHRGAHLGAAVLTVVAVAAAAVSFAWPWAIIIAFIAALSAQALQWRLFFVTEIPLSWKSEVRWSVPPGLAGKEG